MPQSILIFDFGANEEAAQQARHKVEAWKQGFRLGNKMLLKFEREETAALQPSTAPKDESAKPAASAAKSDKKTGKKTGGAKASAKSAGKSAKAAPEPEKSESPAAANGKVRLLVRLVFSDHEKLSHQRWIDRIPTEEPFKSAAGETIRSADSEFQKTAERFDSLD